MSASTCSLVILRPLDLANVYIGAKRGDPECVDMLRMIEKGMTALEKGQRCMFCNHRFPDFRDVAAYVVIEPIGEALFPGELIFFGICDACDAPGNLQGRVIGHLRDKLWPKLAIVGSTEISGTA